MAGGWRISLGIGPALPCQHIVRHQRAQVGLCPVEEAGAVVHLAKRVQRAQQALLLGDGEFGPQGRAGSPAWQGRPIGRWAGHGCRTSAGVLRCHKYLMLKLMYLFKTRRIIDVGVKR
jgi:hypothetical protein